MLLTTPMLGQAASLSTKTSTGGAGCHVQGNVVALCSAMIPEKRFVRQCLALVYARTQPSSVALSKRSGCAYAEKHLLCHILGSRWGRPSQLVAEHFSARRNALSSFFWLFIEGRAHCGGTVRLSKRQILRVSFMTGQ